MPESQCTTEILTFYYLFIQSEKSFVIANDHSSFDKEVQILVALAFWQTGVRKYAGAQVEVLDFIVVPYGEK